MKIGLFGTGAYGLALSSVLTHNRNDVVMWTKFPEEKEQLEKERENPKLLPNFKLDDAVKYQDILAKEHGLLLGISSGAIYFSMLDYIKNNNLKLQQSLSQIKNEGNILENKYVQFTDIKEKLNEELIALRKERTSKEDLFIKRKENLKKILSD